VAKDLDGSILEASKNSKIHAANFLQASTAIILRVDWVPRKAVVTQSDPARGTINVG
jgi:hypothetical protein